MGLQIEDGRGTGSLVKITNDNRMSVNSKQGRRSYYISRDEGQTYNIISHDATAAAGTFICYMQNTSTSLNMFIDLIRVGGENTALWKVWFVTGTAAGGNALTATNLNRSSSNAADVNARGDDSITGLTTDVEIATMRAPANADVDIPFDDTLILGQNDALAVEYDTGTTGIAEVLARVYFEA